MSSSPDFTVLRNSLTSDGKVALAKFTPPILAEYDFGNEDTPFDPLDTAKCKAFVTGYILHQTRVREVEARPLLADAAQPIPKKSKLDASEVYDIIEKASPGMPCLNEKSIVSMNKDPLTYISFNDAFVSFADYSDQRIQHVELLDGTVGPTRVTSKTKKTKNIREWFLTATVWAANATILINRKEEGSEPCYPSAHFTRFISLITQASVSFDDTYALTLDGNSRTLVARSGGALKTRLSTLSNPPMIVQAGIRPPTTIPREGTTPPKAVCHSWLKNGNCSRGATCTFSHETAKA